MDLSKAFGISRGTTREALRQLQDENLVEIVPHHGAFVTTLSPQRAWEIYTLRAQLEPYAVRLAMDRQAFRPQDLEDLDALVRRLGDLAREGDPFAVITTDMEFHRVMCERSDHTLVLDMLRSLRFQTRLFILNTILYHSDLEQNDLTHREILNRIRTGDPLRAETGVHEHIMNAGANLVRSMEAHAESADALTPPAGPRNATEQNSRPRRPRG